jgi:hypothetical protein
MRADYATSDLISKVNSDWINEVLLNSELDRADPGGDVVADDHVPRRQSAGKQTIPAWREPMPTSADSTGVDYLQPGIVEELIARRSRRRSVARRVTERLALAVAALAIVWVGVRMTPEPQDVTNPVSADATIASPEPAAPINTAGLRPAWLSPEILYGPAMARSPLSGPRSGR